MKRAGCNMLAIQAARVLQKFGVENATYSEWICLKDELLKVHVSLDPGTKTYVGHACSAFIEATKEANA